MDNLKKNVLKLLRENARYSIEQISKITGEPADKIGAVIKELET